MSDVEVEKTETVVEVAQSPTSVEVDETTNVVEVTQQQTSVEVIRSDISVEATGDFPGIAVNTLDDIPDGTVYGKIALESLQEGAILLSEAIGTLADVAGTLDDIGDGDLFKRVAAGDIVDGHIEFGSIVDAEGNAITNIDNIPDGDTYAKVKSTYITSGQITITGLYGTYDDLALGDTYDKVKKTDITDGHIQLSALLMDDGETQAGEGKALVNYIDLDAETGQIKLGSTYGNLGDIVDGGGFSKVKSTCISAGKIMLSKIVKDDGETEIGEGKDVISVTDLEAGHIKLSTCYGNLSNIVDGGGFSKVKSTQIRSGEIILARVVNDENANVSSAGLYLGVDYMGYYDGTNWEATSTYIKADGSFRFYKDANNYIEYTGSNLEIKGTVTIRGGSGLGNLSDSGDLAELAATPSDGLYITANYIGYYTTGEWRSYISKDGYFKFYKDPNNYIEYTGSNLIVKGTITLVNTLPHSKVDGLGGLALVDEISSSEITDVGPNADNTAENQDFAYESLTGDKPPANADNTAENQDFSWESITGRPAPLLANSVAGLYLNSTRMGYWNGDDAWITYMDNAGDFFLVGETGGLSWDASEGTLTIQGNITLVNTIPNDKVDGLGDLALKDSANYTDDVSGTKPPTNADHTLTAVEGGISLTGGGLILASGGAAIRGGQTGYDDGVGFWIGDDSGTPKFSIGNSSGDKLTWNGSALAVTGSFTTDTLTATGGTIGGWTISSSQIAKSVSGAVMQIASTSVPRIAVWVSSALKAAMGYLSGGVYGVWGSAGGFGGSDYAGRRVGIGTDGLTLLGDASINITDGTLTAGDVILNSTGVEVGATSGARIEMAGNGYAAYLKGYDSGGSVIVELGLDVSSQSAFYLKKRSAATEHMRQTYNSIYFQDGSNSSLIKYEGTFLDVWSDVRIHTSYELQFGGSNCYIRLVGSDLVFYIGGSCRGYLDATGWHNGAP